MIASAIAVSRINDFYDYVSEGSNDAEDRDRYRGVAGSLLFVSIVGIVIQPIMAIIRILYFTEAIKAQFFVFAILVSSMSLYITICIVTYTYVYIYIYV